MRVRMQLNPMRWRRAASASTKSQGAVPDGQRQPSDRNALRRASRLSPCNPTGSLTDAAAYRPVIVAYRNGQPVRLEELGDVIDSVENDKAAAWFNGDAARSFWRCSASPAPTPSKW